MNSDELFMFLLPKVAKITATIEVVSIIGILILVLRRIVMCEKSFKEKIVTVSIGVSMTLSTICILMSIMLNRDFSIMESICSLIVGVGIAYIIRKIKLYDFSVIEIGAMAVAVKALISVGLFVAVILKGESLKMAIFFCLIFWCLYAMSLRKRVRSINTVKSKVVYTIRYTFRLLILAGLVLSVLTFFNGDKPFKGFVYEKTVEVLEDPKIVEVEKIIEVEKEVNIPSIMLPLEPEGTQAILIDTRSKEMQKFMDGLYGENVNFFAKRQNATFLITEDGIQNYSGLDISDIEYTDNSNEIVIEDMGFDTLWIFSTMENIQFSTESKLVIYSPEELLKKVDNAMIITVKEIK